MTDDESTIDPQPEPADETLVPDGSGEATIRPAERRRRLAKEKQAEARKAWMEAYGPMPLARHALDKVADHGRPAGDGPNLDMELLDIEPEAIHEAKGKPRRYYRNDWGF